MSAAYLLGLSAASCLAANAEPAGHAQTGTNYTRGFLRCQPHRRAERRSADTQYMRRRWACQRADDLSLSASVRPGGGPGALIMLVDCAHDAPRATTCTRVRESCIGQARPNGSFGRHKAATSRVVVTMRRQGAPRGGRPGARPAAEMARRESGRHSPDHRSGVRRPA